MNIIECNVDNIKKYELDIWCLDRCDNLCSLKQNRDNYFFDCSGLTKVIDFINTFKRASVTDSFYLALSIIRKTVEAKVAVSRFLINESSICIDMDKLFINADNKIVLSPGYSNESFFERLCELSDSLGYPEISDRLRDENTKKIMNEKDILSFLSAWELELR